MAKSGQRFIRENRAPRVHIEYEVETYGSRQKVELPFVMGVMSDLSGKSEVEKKSLDKREFVEFDMDNFEQRMEAIAPRAVIPVDNTLTGEGKMRRRPDFKCMRRLHAGRGRQERPGARQAARSAPAAQRPDGVHGRQGRRPGPAGQGAQGSELLKALAAAKPAEGEEASER